MPGSRLRGVDTVNASGFLERRITGRRLTPQYVMLS